VCVVVCGLLFVFVWCVMVKFCGVCVWLVVGVLWWVVVLCCWGGVSVV
jgi:hypothetical protein